MTQWHKSRLDHLIRPDLQKCWMRCVAGTCSQRCQILGPWMSNASNQKEVSLTVSRFLLVQQHTEGAEGQQTNNNEQVSKYYIPGAMGCHHSQMHCHHSLSSSSYPSYSCHPCDEICPHASNNLVEGQATNFDTDRSTLHSLPQFQTATFNQQQSFDMMLKF